MLHKEILITYTDKKYIGRDQECLPEEWQPKTMIMVAWYIGSMDGVALKEAAAVICSDPFTIIDF